MNVVFAYFRAVKKVTSIQGRLAVILCNLPHRPKQKKILSPKDGLVPLSCLCATSKHVIEQRGNKFFCVQCRQFASGSKTDIVEFVCGSCIPPRRKNVKGFEQILAPITLGGRVSHPSHTLCCYRNLFFCQKCGYLAQKHISKLGRIVAARG